MLFIQPVRYNLVFDFELWINNAECRSTCPCTPLCVASKRPTIDSRPSQRQTPKQTFTCHPPSKNNTHQRPKTSQKHTLASTTENRGGGPGGESVLLTRPPPFSVVLGKIIPAHALSGKPSSLHAGITRSRARAHNCNQLALYIKVPLCNDAYNTVSRCCHFEAHRPFAR